MSPLFKINTRDILRGALLAALVSIGNALVGVFQSGAFPSLIELQHTATIGLGCGFAYLVKNFITNSEDKILKPEGY